MSWEKAHNLLTALWRTGVIQYIRFRPLEKNLRDSKAFYRLRSTEPIPDGAHEPDHLSGSGK